MRCIQLPTATAFYLVLAGCAVQGYEGAALPDSETAFVTANSNADLWIGIGVPGTRISHDLRLLPGYRCVNVEASTGNASYYGGLGRVGREFELCFEANAGKTYEVKGLLSCDVLERRGGCRPGSSRIQTARIEDAETGEVLDVKEAI